MRQKITHYLRPSFFVFLLLAAVLWYGDKLEDRYTTDITLPVRIENDYSSALWIREPEIEIQVRVEGLGSHLVAYKTGLEDKVVVPMSQLTLVPVGREQTAEEEQIYNVDKRSLIGILSGRTRELRILQVLDTAVRITVSPVETRRLPVRSRIAIHTARQYMQAGETRLQPDSVDVRAPRVILDTLSDIKTLPRTYRDRRGMVNGRIDLEQTPGVVLSERQVAFWAEVVPFTQYTAQVPVGIVGMPDNLRATIIPAQVSVVVNVPLNVYERLQEENLNAYIDYRCALDNASGRCVVLLDSLPLGAEVLEIQPQYVEPFFPGDNLRRC